MSWAARHWDGRAWAGLGNATTSGGAVIVDPANPNASGFSWATQTGGAPWSGGVWGGGGQIAQATSGGITAYPDPDTGVVNLAAWWTEATYLRVVRLVGDERVPVRGASPLSVGGSTQHNYCTNPSFEIDLTGWLAGANTTLTRIVGTALGGVAFGRAKATAAGSVTVTAPVALPIPEGAMAVSFGLYLSALPSGDVTVNVAWQDGSGAGLGTTSASLAAVDTLSSYVGRWQRTPPLILTPPAAAANGTLTITVTGNLINATADLDTVLIEAASTATGVYFDGSDPYAGWQGTANQSISSLAVPVQFVDAEAPLDVPVSYELTAPDQPSLRVVSQPVTLLSNGHTWLTHPVLQEPLSITVLEEPDQARAIDRGVHRVIGRVNPIAVSAAQRASVEASLDVLVVSFAERDTVWSMLEDGQPLLLRAPAELGHGPGEWLSVGDVSLKRPGHGAWEDARVFTLPYVVVDAPAANPDDPMAA